MNSFAFPRLLCRFFSVSVGLAVCLGCMGSAARAQSIVDPGFETGTLSSWQTVVFGSQGSVTVGPAAHSGRYGLTQGPNNNAEVAYQDVLGLVPGQTYLVSAWVASSSTNTGSITLAVHDTEGGNWQSTGLTPSNFWQRVSQAYTVNGTGALRIHLYENQGPETTYWDDVTLTPVPPVNAGFETGTLGPWQTAVFGSTGSVAVGTVAHAGNYGLTQGPNNGSEVAYQDLTGLLPGQTYLVSAWVRSSTATSSTVTLAVHGFNAGTWVSTDFVPTTAWGQISQSFTVGSNGILRVHLYENAGPETTYWDDVSVIPLPPVNAGFESGQLSPWQTGNGTVSTVGTVAHSGTYGLTQSAGNAAQVTFQDVYGLTPGQTYLVSAWVLSSATTNSTVTLAVHDTLGHGWVSNTITPTTTWQPVSQAYTADSTGALRIHLYTNPGTEVTYWDDVTVSNTSGQAAAALWAGDTAVWGGFNNVDLWADPFFLSLSPATPAKEYIRLNGQVIATENASH